MSEYNIEYILTKNNIKTVKVNGYLLHSKYDPIQEAIRIVEKEFEPNYVHVLFGYGLGYIADALREKINDASKLIIVDPIYHLFPECNKGLKITSHIEIVKFEAEIAGALKNLSKKVKVICSPNYDNILPEEFAKVLKVIKDVQNLKRVNENTIRIFADSWQENYIHNLLNVYRSNSLMVLEKKYSCPVILASGGPSLTKQLLLLKKVQNHVIIIAAGSTINSLLNQGIEPDFIVTVDGSIANYNHFKDIKNIKSKLIYALSSHYKIQDEFYNDKYAFVDSNSKAYGNHIKNIFSIELPLIKGGGSVANFAFSIACKLTNGPIAIIGQDLAYTDNKTHAESNKHFRKLDSALEKETGIFEIQGYNDDKVLTDYVFLAMKKAFELINESIQHESVIYNCTEGGAKIKGMNQLSFVDFCERHIDKQVKVNKEILNNHMKPDFSDFVDVLNEQIITFNGIIKELKFALILLEQTQSSKSFSKKILKKLDKIDELIKRIFEEVSLNYITDPIMLDVLRNYQPLLNENSEDIYNRIYNQNQELYSRLLEAIEKTRQYTLDTIEKAKIL